MAKVEMELSRGTMVRIDTVYAAIGGVAGLDFAIWAIQDSSMNPGRLEGDIIGAAIGVIVAAVGIVMAFRDSRKPSSENTNLLPN
jgi:hypothetical protein